MYKKKICNYNKFPSLEQILVENLNMCKYLINCFFPQPLFPSLLILINVSNYFRGYYYFSLNIIFSICGLRFLALRKNCK